jgi:hypothetical protein
VCTGNENSKPIWNKFIIRKDIIETSQVVLSFCRTVHIYIYIHIYIYPNSNNRNDYSIINNVSDDELDTYILIGQTYVKLRLLHRFRK